jgi:hypothetical protein
MVFKLPNKEQVKFARSAFRDLLNELDSSRTRLSSGTSPLPNVLPELRAAVTKPGVDPREMALNMIRTGRVGGKKISSNERREVGTINDYINQLTKNAEDIRTSNYFFTPSSRIRKNTKNYFNTYNTRNINTAERLRRDYGYKLDAAELRPEDIANVKALQTMLGMKALESGVPGSMARGVKSKFITPIKNNQYIGNTNISRFSDKVVDYDKQMRAARKLEKASGKQDFEYKFQTGSRWARDKDGNDFLRPNTSDVLDILYDAGIQRTPEIDEMIITLLPEWLGTGDEFVYMLKTFM